MIYIIVINLFLQLMHLTFRKEVATTEKSPLSHPLPDLVFQFLDAFPLRFRCNGGFPLKSGAFSPFQRKNPFFPPP